MISTRLLAAALIVAALTVAVRAQDLTGTLEGAVRASSGATPAGLQVRAVSGTVVVTTDPGADGSFMFTDLPLDNYRVQVVDSAGRVLASSNARLTAAAPAQSLMLTVRTAATGFSGRLGEPARFYVGPVGATPSIAILNGGVATNVFNDASDPKSDTAFIVEPQALVTLDAAPVRGEGMVRGRYLYFDKYSGERSLDVDAQGGLEVAVARVTPWARGLVDGGRRRLNHEIDLRARQLTSGIQVGVDARVGGRTIASVGVGRTDHGFDQSEIFLGANLQELLNRKATSTTIEVRQTLTPGISAVGQVNVVGERFRFAPQRDSDILRLQGGLVTNVADRVAGSIRLGYIKLNAVGGAIGDYRGLVAAVDEDLRLGSRTRLLITGIRDIDYSYETSFPDYLRTGAVADLRTQLSSVWDVGLRVEGEQMLHEPAAGLAADRYAEQYGFIGGGLGVSIARALRLGIDAGREERDSPVAGRGFIGYRFGAALTVGPRPGRVCGCGFE